MDLSQALLEQHGSCKVHPNFYLFLVCDNDASSNESEVATILTQNTNSACELLRLESFSFLSELLHNKSLKEFLVTYLAVRRKPYQKQTAEEYVARQLTALDRCVFLIFSRVAALGHELPNIAAQIPKPKLSVLSKSSPAALSLGETDRINEKRLRDQFAILIASMPPFLKFPYIIDLISIIGETNISLSAVLLNDLFQFRPVTRKELSASLLETFETVGKLESQVMIVLRELSGGSSDSNRKKNGSLKASTSTKKSSLPNSEPQSPQQQLEFFYAFAADIVYSLCCFLEAASDVLISTCIFSSQNPSQLSTQFGAKLFHMLRKLYESALPAALKAESLLRSQSTISPNTPTAINSSEYINIIKLKTLKCLKLLLSASRRSLRQQDGNKSLKASQDDGVPWPDLLQSASDSAENSSENWLVASGSSLQGVFLSDFVVLYGPGEVESVLRMSLGDEMTDSPCHGGLSDYFLASLTVKDSLLHPANTPSSSAEKVDSKSSGSKGSLPSAAEAPSQPRLSREEAISAIRNVLPDLGEGFIEACLDIYNGSADRVIDAILTEDLHPALKGLDRRLQKVWIGKKDTEPEFLKPSSAAAAAASDNARSLTKERARLMQRQQEWDSYILSKEYDDDYDDQFDENIASRTIEDKFEDCLESAVKGRAGNGRNASRPITDLDKQIAETRRLNSLIREEEQEIQFWESMRNTNREGGRNASSDNWKRAEGDDDAVQERNPPNEARLKSSKADPQKKKESVEQPKSTKKSVEGNKDREGGDAEKRSTGKESSDQKKAYRTKTHDAHHQKDKALRKMGNW